MIIIRADIAGSALTGLFASGMSETICTSMPSGSTCCHLPEARPSAEASASWRITRLSAVQNLHRFGNKVIERAFAFAGNLKVLVDLSDDLIRKGFKDGFGVRKVAINSLSGDSSLLCE